jgi:CBS domain
LLRLPVRGATGNLQRATEDASYAGQAVGWLLIVWGFARVLAGDVLGGVWTAFIGWFLNNAAESTRHGQARREALRGVPVSRPVDQPPAVATAGLRVQDFVFEQVLQRGHRALPIVDDGRLVGIVTLGDAKKLPRDAWPTTPVVSIMTSIP